MLKKSLNKPKIFLCSKLRILLIFCLVISIFSPTIQINADDMKFLEEKNESPKVGEYLHLDSNKFYKIYDAYDEHGRELDAVSENSRVIFNNGGKKVGWLKYGNRFEDTATTNYLWKATPYSQNEYILTNQVAQAAHSIVADTIGNDLNGGGAQNFAVVRKGNLSKGSPLKFIVMAIENGKTYVKIEQSAYTDESGLKVSGGRYMSTEDVPITKNTDVTKNNVKSYVTWIDNVSETDRTNGWWVIEEVTTLPGSVKGSKLMFSTFSQKYHYRIPAITTTNKGGIVLFSDYRYDSNSDIGTNWSGWNGVDSSGYGKIGHRIDQVMRYSSDNGVSWSAEKNLTEKYSYKGETNVKLANGYGDPAIVADRDSDKVLMLSVGGSYGFLQEYPGIISMLSNDGGKTFGEPKPLGGRTNGTSAISEIPNNLGIYELDNGGSEIYSMFVTSGRIMQSRYIKVGSSYRIYCAMLAKVRGSNEHKNFVFYSDDFGDNWSVLPGIAINGGDEAKVEELPDGNVVISSRTSGGRKINIFTYNENDKRYMTGNWGKQSQFTIPGSKAAVNGDLYVFYAKNNTTNQYGYLICQTLAQGQDRSDVRVYYRWIDEDINTPEEFSKGFTVENSFTLSKNSSAYSVLTLLADGKIAFAWEEGDMYYNIAFAALSLEEITNHKFSLSFSSGIGSVDSPYIINTDEELTAYSNVYSKERVYFKLSRSSLNVMKPELEEVYDIDKSIKGKVFMHELSGTGHKVQLIDKEGNLLTEKTIEPNEKDGVPVSDSVEFEFTDVDSSKLIAKDELKVQIVSPDFDKLEESSTIIKESPKPIDKEVVGVNFKPDPKESIIKICRKMLLMSGKKNQIRQKLQIAR